MIEMEMAPLNLKIQAHLKQETMLWELPIQHLSSSQTRLTDLLMQQVHLMAEVLNLLSKGWLAS